MNDKIKIDERLRSWLTQHPTPWKVFRDGDDPTGLHLIGNAEKREHEGEVAIFDSNGMEVLGTSEWLRADDELLDLIVTLANRCE